MHFNRHSELSGRHAFLSASKGHWTNYEDEKLLQVWRTARAAQRGTDLHEYAMTAIRLRIRQGRSKQTLNMYINDAIGFNMRPEVVLKYSDLCFGTADTIGFSEGLLRIHDLKTGVTPGHMRQLEIYAALFCLEYEQKPHLIEIELRIYQNDDIVKHVPDPEVILRIMNKIERFDAILTQQLEEERF